MKKVIQVIALVLFVVFAQAQKNTIMVGTTLVEVTGNLVGDAKYDDILTIVKSYCLVDKKNGKLYVATANYDYVDDTKATELNTVTVNLSDIKLEQPTATKVTAGKSVAGKEVYKVGVQCI
jgi:hypothetical protein